MYPEQLCEGTQQLGQDDKSLLSLIYERLHVTEESFLKGMMAWVCQYQCPYYIYFRYLFFGDRKSKIFKYRQIISTAALVGTEILYAEKEH